jgi:integration host factor subunit beta
VTKSELIEILATKSDGLSPTDAKLAVNIIMNAMTPALEKGEGIEVQGFGGFSLRHFPARNARNPKTAETVQLQPRSAVHLKPGFQMRE